MFSTFKTKNLERGFTLLEMLVVIAIMIIITGVVLANFPGFRDKTSLDLIAQEIAITIRQAQVFGIGTKAALSGVAATEFSSYGAYFNYPFPSNEFIIYADSDNASSGRPGKYDPGAGCGEPANATECREQFFLRGGVEITGIQLCNATCVPVEENLNIAFLRPEVDAIYFKDSTPIDLSDIPGSGESYGYAKIKISKAGEDRFINVWSTGHIYVSRE